MAITLEERVFGCIVTGKVKLDPEIPCRYGFHGEASFLSLPDSVAIEFRNAASDCFRFITLKQNVRVLKQITDFFIFVEINFDDSLIRGCA